LRKHLKMIRAWIQYISSADIFDIAVEGTSELLRYAHPFSANPPWIGTSNQTVPFIPLLLIHFVYLFASNRRRILCFNAFTCTQRKLTYGIASSKTS
jgi:hypothetical protein